VADTPYTRAVSAYTWTALAGRCLEPGVKADMAPVLIGLQAAGKTTAVEALAPFNDADESAFVEINLTKKDEDIARSLRGKLVGEIAELRGLQSRDAESIKAWVSRRFEEWTPKYEEFGTRFARRLLLIGTGNKDGFLDDETGERRWLPMRVGAVDVAGIRRERDQLWAEGRTGSALGRGLADAYELAKAEHGVQDHRHLGRRGRALAGARRWTGRPACREARELCE
jgi:predicted P-loop ATPase